MSTDLTERNSSPATEVPAIEPPATWMLVLAFGLIYTSWGTTYLAIKKGVQIEQLPPALFGGVRISLAGTLIFGFLLLRGYSLRLSRRDLVTSALAGVILFVAGNGMITLAQKTVPSSVAAVLAATTPVWIAVLSMIWPRGERMGLAGWLGVLLGLVGVLLLLSDRLEDPAIFVRDLAPLLVLGSACAWALGSLIVRYRRVEGSYLAAAAYQMILGGICLTAVGLAAGEWNELPAELTTGAIGSFLYLLIVGSLIGFIAYNWLLRHVTAAQASTYAYVNPVVAVLIGWWDGESMTVGIVGGIAVILIGVALVRDSTYAGSPRPQETTSRDVGPAERDTSEDAARLPHQSLR